MTQKISSSKHKGPLVTPRYLLGTAKRAWALLVLFFIAFLFTSTIPALLELTELYRIDNYYDEMINPSGLPSSSVGGYGEVRPDIDTEEDPDARDPVQLEAERQKELLRDTLGTANLIKGMFCAASSVAAVFAGMYFMKFMHNKVSAGFYHALPERRSGHFISAVASAAIIYLIAAVTNILLSMLVLASGGYLFAEAVPIFLSAIGYGVFYFFVFLSVTVLAGSVSGSPAIQACMTAFILFAVPALYLSFNVLLNYGKNLGLIKFVSTWYYDSFANFTLQSPVFREIYILSGMNATDEAGMMIPTPLLITIDAVMTVLFFGLAYFAYSKRKIERSGSSIVFAPLAEAVKYVIMGPAAVMLAYFFGSVITGDGITLWSIFGLAAGLLLTFMLCNTVLNRSGRAMFAHIKGLFIFSGAFLAVCIVSVTGFFGVLDRIVPTADELVITVGRQTVTLTDKSDINAVRDAIKKCIPTFLEHADDARDGAYSWSSEYYSEPDYGADFSGGDLPKSFGEDAPHISRTVDGVSVVYQNSLGGRVRYAYSDYSDYGDVKPIIDALLACDSFKEQLSLPKDMTPETVSASFTLPTSALFDTGAFSVEYFGIYDNYDDDEYMEKIKGFLRGKLVDLNVETWSVDKLLDQTELADEIIRRYSSVSEDYFQKQTSGMMRFEYYIKDQNAYEGYETASKSYSIASSFDDLSLLGYFNRDLTNIYSDFDKMYAYSYSPTELVYPSDDALEKIAGMTYDEYLDGIAEAVDEIQIFRKSTGELTTVTGSAVRDILPRLASLDGSGIPILTRTDSDYVVLLSVRTLRADYAESVSDETLSDSFIFYDGYDKLVLQEGHEYFVTWFLEGQASMG